MTLFQSGTSESTRIGYVNRHGQLCTGHRGKPGTDHGQRSYRLLCLNIDCGHTYGANGTDIFERRCPKCQGGSPGIEY